jgi:DNA modification methylase
VSKWQVIQGDCLSVLATTPERSVQCCVTSPPYFGLRDYGVEGQIGLEASPAEYVARMVEVFGAVRRVMRDDGTLWLNLGDSYAANRGGTPMPAETLAGGVSGRGDKVAKRGRESEYLPHRDAASHGLKHKDLMGIPWRVAFALQADGWYLRSDIIWHKPNPMPESVTDRPTKAHEYIFLLAKSERYHYDAGAIAEPAAYAGQMRGGSTNRYEQNASGMDNKIYDTRNKRTVWSVQPQPYKGAHFATYPEELIEPCILAGCPIGGTVLDPFNGSGTTGAVSVRHGRDYIGIELNPEYVALAERRIGGEAPLFVKGGAA